MDALFKFIASSTGESFQQFLTLNHYNVARAIFIVLDIALLIGIIIIFPQFMKYVPRFTARRMESPKEPILETKNTQYKARWDAISEKAESAPPHSLTLAIIDADSFVDTILKDLGLEGEHMADRLEKLDTRNLTSLDNLWKAHRARNNLVHTPEYDLHPVDAKRYLEYYEHFLKEIRAL
jgi:hypothetical protein